MRKKKIIKIIFILAIFIVLLISLPKVFPNAFTEYNGSIPVTTNKLICLDGAMVDNIKECIKEYIVEFKHETPQKEFDALILNTEAEVQRNIHKELLLEPAPIFSIKIMDSYVKTFEESKWVKSIEVHDSSLQQAIPY